MVTRESAREPPRAHESRRKHTIVTETIRKSLRAHEGRGLVVDGGADVNVWASEATLPTGYPSSTCEMISSLFSLDVSKY